MVIKFVAMVLPVSLCSSSPPCIYGSFKRGDLPCADYDRFMPLLPLTDYRKMLELLVNRRSVLREPMTKFYPHAGNGDISLRQTIQTILMKKPTGDISLD
uniref:Secreted protein n=1 Tax=Ascaris lumbricoides TaxID=6252 RepID=A0A0M3I5M3_ASCLU